MYSLFKNFKKVEASTVLNFKEKPDQMVDWVNHRDWYVMVQSVYDQEECWDGSLSLDVELCTQLLVMVAGFRNRSLPAPVFRGASGH